MVSGWPPIADLRLGPCSTTQVLQGTAGRERMFESSSSPSTEKAFGIDEYLGHANDTELGVKAMGPLFQVK
jgi:hypothetical protein